MLNIKEPEPKEPPKGFSNLPVWQLAFRSHFLAGAALAAIAILYWLLVITGVTSMPAQAIPAVLWHIHEMIFGFAALIAVGFIMTAVQTWAGRPSITGKPVIYLLSVWLAIRLMLWLNSELSIMVALMLQLLWWVSVIIFYSRIVIAAQNRRNYLFIPLFSGLAALNLAVLGLAWLGQTLLAMHLIKAALLLFTLVMTVIGGRVIPFFTVRGAGTDPIANIDWIERIILPAAITCVVAYIASYFIEIAPVLSVLMIGAGVLHMARMAPWKTLSTGSVPLLWSLHGSYAFMGLGLIAWGASLVNIGISQSSAIHVITIGAIGLMIISMMSRVSLGHTGRMLQIKPQMILAYVLLIAAVIARALLPEIGMPVMGWWLSGIAWVLAMVLFVIVYWPILTAPRKN